MMLGSRALCLAASIAGLRAVATLGTRFNCLTALDIWGLVSSRRCELVTCLLFLADTLCRSAPVINAVVVTVVGAGAGRWGIVDRARTITNPSVSGGIHTNMAAASVFTFAVVRCHLDC
jgi:hypothetical protein